MTWALISHWCQAQHFLVLLEVSQTLLGDQCALLHHRCLSEVLKKHLKVCKQLQMWAYTKGGDACRLLSVYLWQKCRAGHIWERTSSLGFFKEQEPLQSK